MSIHHDTFRQARPIYARGLACEMNTFVGLRAVLAPGRSLLRIAGSSVYRIWVDGAFAGYGPARAGHGSYRVDEIDLGEAAGPRVVAVEVAGYNVNSYYLLDQPAFLRAEVENGGRIAAATGRSGFEAKLLTHRVRRVQRYSFQRPFVEMYEMSGGDDRWRLGEGAMEAEMEEVADGPMLARGLPLPAYALRPATELACGELGPGPADRHVDRSVTRVGPDYKGYARDQIAELLSDTLQQVRPATRRGPAGRPWSIATGQYRLFDLGANRSGFLKLRVQCPAPCRLVAQFDELLLDGNVAFERMRDCVNAVSWRLPAGTHALESFEPYTLRWVRLMALEGACEVAEVQLREYAHPHDPAGQFESADERLNVLWRAAGETFRQNCVDLYTDCPHRERAGWLDNAYWMAPTELLLTGRSDFERVFFENFLSCPADDPRLPRGMMPMCYPADHYDGNYIPQWPVWFVMELEGYLARTGDRAMVDALQSRVFAFFEQALSPYENSDGLVERLQGWRFVEWSHANSLQDDVNYPTNMQLAAGLATAGRLYDRPDFLARARRMHRTIREQSFDGEFFVDNAIRADGKLVRGGESTEVCQYFAFAFGTATPDSHPQLWRRLVEEFGPRRRERGLWPKVHSANLINGIYLRLNLLTAAGRFGQVLDELADYFLGMARTNGTLWEHTDTRASCNHGCSSHVAVWLARAATGLVAIDPVRRVVRLAATPAGLPATTLRIPTADGPIVLSHRDARTTARTPAGWRCEPA